MWQIVIDSLEIQDLVHGEHGEGKIKEAITIALQKFIEQNGIPAHLKHSNASIFLDTVTLEVPPETSTQEIGHAIAQRIYQDK